MSTRLREMLTPLRARRSPADYTPAEAQTPADLLSANGTWWSATRGFTVGVTCDWVDQLASPITMSQAAANKFPAQISGYLRFDGVEDYLDFPVTAKTTPTTTYYIGIWRRRHSVAAVQTFWSQYGAGGNKTCLISDSDGETSALFGAFTTPNTYPIIPLDTPTYEEYVFNGGASPVADRVRLFRGLAEVTRNTSSANLPASLPTPTNNRLAAYSLSESSHAGIDVWAIYVDTVVPDLATRTALMNFEAPT